MAFAFGALTVGFAAGFAVSLWATNMFSFVGDSFDPVQLNEVAMHSPDEEFHKDEDLVAKELAERVRVLCIVFVSPKTLDKANHLRKTWAKRCNKHVFFSSAPDQEIPVIKLPLENTKDCRWRRTKEGLKYVYLHLMDSVDWVLVADEGTYVIVENLRYLLSGQNSSEALYFGRRLCAQGYNTTLVSSNAGFVLSQVAVRKLVIEGFPDKEKCSHKNKVGFLDLELGRCLERTGIRGVDTRDNLDRGRFFPFLPLAQLAVKGGGDYKYWRTEEEMGFNCCSDLTISFHYYEVLDMYIMEFLIYHVRPHGILHNTSVDLNRSPGDVSCSTMPIQS